MVNDYHDLRGGEGGALIKELHDRHVGIACNDYNGSTEATTPKPSMQIEWYCLAVHKNTCERTFEYAESQETDGQKGQILSSFFFLIQDS